MKQAVKNSSVRFRCCFEGINYLGSAEVRTWTGNGMTDEFGYTDDDEVAVDLDTVYDEDLREEVFALGKRSNYPLRSALEAAALDEHYNPTSSMKIFPGEEEAYFDGMVSLGKWGEEGYLMAA